MIDNPPFSGDAFSSFDGELPGEVTALLAACQGKRNPYGEALAWSVTKLRRRNREMRTTPTFQIL